MSTTLVKPAEVERKWYLLDATGKSLGHVAAEAAVLLRGKQKVDYTPNVDCGDFVVVINCDKAVRSFIMLTAITGINWGDEGKGRMVDLLSQDYDIVAAIRAATTPATPSRTSAASSC